MDSIAQELLFTSKDKLRNAKNVKGNKITIIDVYEEVVLPKANSKESNDVKLLEVYAEELNANINDLRKYAEENEIDISGLKKKEDIQLAIAKFLDK